jgi:phospholipid transport system substrate-binding protein
MHSEKFEVIMKNKITLKTTALLFFFSLIFLLPQQTDAGEPTEQVKVTVDAVIKILNNKELKKAANSEARRKKIRETVEKRFGFEEMAKRSLGIHWKNRSSGEQKEFTALFTDLIEDSYIRKIERYENERVVYTDEKTDGSHAIVRTKILTTKDTEIPVDYKILKKGQEWEVYDIIVEGVSLVNNYRTQFNQIIRSASYEDLVIRLKKKTLK